MKDVSEETATLKISSSRQRVTKAANSCKWMRRLLMVKSGLDLDHRQHEHDHAHEQRHSCWSHSRSVSTDRKSKYARDSDAALSGATIVIGAAMSGV